MYYTHWRLFSVSTLLEIQRPDKPSVEECLNDIMFQPFLRFNVTPEDPEYRCGVIYFQFQPFLRFNTQSP